MVAKTDSASAVSTNALILAPADLEVIAGYRVHPLTSRFPLVVGKEFDDMVEAAARARRLQPIETHQGLLIDGRIRLLVREELRQRNIDVEMPVFEWQPIGDETVEEHIWAVNYHRRHSDPDQRAALAVVCLPEIEAARRRKQEASRFGAQVIDAVASKSPPPLQSSRGPGRTSKEKDEASTVGQLAKLANVSHYKAKQAVALSKAVEAGEVSESVFRAVQHGDKRLRDVEPVRHKESKDKKNQRASKNRVRSSEPKDGVDDDQAPSEAAARLHWERLTARLAVADMPAWRRLFLKVIRDDQRKYGE